ncbi:MAG: hypothetical protein ACK6BG_00085 [Cyanobacteriota bacterium]
MPLPAPYAPPWKRLGEDGVALLAWLGLKARELWRRNREGGLPVPAFWPRRRPWLFWPLALSVLLIGSGLLARSWLGVTAARPAAPSVEFQSPPAERALAGPMAEGLAAEPAARSEAQSAERPETTLSERPANDLADAAAAEQPEEPQDPVEALPAPLPSPTEREALRLRAAWSEDAAATLILAFRPEPATFTRTLTLDDAFLSLGARERERLAERWRQQAMEAGYSHLRLRERRGRLVGRDAIVGSGMVVLEPPGEGGQEP